MTSGSSHEVEKTEDNFPDRLSEMKTTKIHCPRFWGLPNMPFHMVGKPNLIRKELEVLEISASCDCVLPVVVDSAGLNTG